MISIPELSNQHETLEWRLYRNMLVTRLFEDALVRWEQEGKISAQTFPSKGQEAIAIGCCAALEHGDTVIPSFRTRGAMIRPGAVMRRHAWINDDRRASVAGGRTCLGDAAR